MIIMNLERRIIELENDKNRMRFEKDHEIEMLQEENKRKIDEMKNQSSRASNLQKIHTDRTLMNIVADVVNDTIPEIEYERLKALPESQLRPEEIHLVHVWELITPLKRDKHSLKNDIDSLRTELKSGNEKYQNILMELNHANDLLSKKDDDVRRSSKNYETSIKMLQSELNKSLIDLESLREKGSKYDDLYREYVKLEKEKIVLENKVQFFSGVPDVKHDVPQNDQDMKAKYSILCTDKEYLTKENLRLLEVNKRLEERIARLENELEETKKMAKDYLT
mmetsp:Transcript_13111/g.11189  ORF Transcript_13111/g.11189 Transcript_13111/m.11189 type:complete len:280 (+) Transcript_13111:316-1155(+)